MLGFIEQIERGHGEIKLPFGLRLKETLDILDISNGKPNLWILSLFSGYRQLGRFKVKRPHNFRERMWVDVEIEKNKIISVKSIDKVSEKNELWC